MGRPGDTIVGVNGAQGHVLALLDKIDRDKVLNLRVVRGAVNRLVASTEQFEDLASFTMLPAVDACVLADITSDECNSIRGSQWIPAMFERLKPVFVDMSWPPKATSLGKGSTDAVSLLEVAKTAGCTIVDPLELLFEQTRTCTCAWTGKEVPPHQHLARSLVEGWTSDTNRLRQVVLGITKTNHAAA